MEEVGLNWQDPVKMLFSSLSRMHRLPKSPRLRKSANLIPIWVCSFYPSVAHHSPIAEFVGQDLLLTTARERHSVKEFPPAWVVDIGQTNLNFY